MRLACHVIFVLLVVSTVNATAPLASTSAQIVTTKPKPVEASPAPYTYRLLSGQHTVSGVQQALVILVDFEDVRHTKSADQVKDVAVDQLNAYYEEVSYGKVSIKEQIFGWYTLAESMGYYGHDSRKPGDDVNIDQLAFDALLKLPTSLDLTPFEYLVIVHAGLDQADDQNKILSDEIWSSCSCSVFPHYHAVNPIHVGSKSFVNYAFLSEFNGVGTYAHEWGHLFGLPDLYDTTTEGNSFVGYWSLMDVGNRCCGNATESTPSYPGGWMATLLGWITPSVVDSRLLVSTFALHPLESTNATAILIPISLLAYYFMEYRTRTGSDSQLPGSGVLIYFVDEGLENGILKLVNPETGKPVSSQKRGLLNKAIFNSQDQMVDDINHIYAAFSTSTDFITVIYSKLGLAPYLVRTGLTTSLTAVEGMYGDRISFTGVLLDTRGNPLPEQEVRVDMFDASSSQWLDMGRSITDQQGHISLEGKLTSAVGGYKLRLLYLGGRSGEILYASSNVEIGLQILPAKMLITMTAPLLVPSGEYAVEVSVVDSHGEPLAGVSVELYVNNAKKGTVQTSACGNGTLMMQFGFDEIGHVLVANATLPNYAPAKASTATVNLGSALPITLAAIAVIGLAVWKRKSVKVNEPR